MAEVRRDMEPYMHLSLITFLMRIQSTGSSNCIWSTMSICMIVMETEPQLPIAVQGLYRDSAAKKEWRRLVLVKD